MFHHVGRVRGQQTLRHERDVQGSALQLDVQEVDQLVHPDGIGPDGSPEPGRPQICVIVRVDVPVNREDLVSSGDEPAQRDVIKSGEDRAQFPAEDLVYPVDETTMIVVGEGVEVLEVEDDDLVRVRGQPVGDVQKRLADLRAVEAVEEVHVLAAGFRGDAQIQVTNSAVQLPLDIVALCNRPI